MTGDEPGPAGLERLVARLEETAARLRAGDLEPEQAAALIDACAQTAGQASGELERLARVAASEQNPSPPTPDQLV